MAEDIASLKAEIEGVLKMFKDSLSTIVAELSSASSEVMKSAADEGKAAMKEFSRDAQTDIGGLKPLFRQIFGTDLADTIKRDFFDSAVGAFEMVKQKFSSENLKMHIDGADLLEQFGGVLGQMREELLDSNNLMAGFDIGRAKLASEAVQLFGAPLNKLEQHVLGVTKEAVDMFAAFSSGTTTVGGATEILDRNISTFTTKIVDAATKTGMSWEDAKKSLLALGQAGVDIQQSGAFEFKIDTGQATDALDGLTAAMLVAKGTGLEVSEIGRHMTMAMRNLGIEGEDSIRMFGALKVAQEDSNLSLQKVASDVLAGAERFKMFGGNVESVAAIYQSLVQSLGEGREGLAADLLTTITSGLASMRNEWRAFLGMTGQVGAGAGGAVGGMLRVEEALENGDLDSVLADIQSTAERLTGTEILTRSQAIDTGQEQQFFMQRAIIGQALGNQDPAQMSRIMEMLAGGQQISAEDVRGRADREFEGILSQGQDVINRQVGSIQQLINMFDAQGIDATDRMRGSIVELSTSMGAFVEGPGAQMLGFLRSSPADRAAAELGLDAPRRTAEEYAAINAEESMRRGGIAGLGTAAMAGDFGVLGNLETTLGNAGKAFQFGVAGGLETALGASSAAFKENVISSATFFADKIKDLPMNKMEPSSMIDGNIAAIEAMKLKEPELTSPARAVIKPTLMEPLRITFELDEASMQFRPMFEGAGKAMFKEMLLEFQSDTSDGGR